MPSANPKQPTLKQKTLLGFFNKSTSSTTSSSKEKPSPPATKSSDKIVQTPFSKNTIRGESEDEDGEDTRKVDPTSSVASSFKSYGSCVSGYAKDTPPTSDIIDIDMLSDLTEEEDAVIQKTVSPQILFHDKIRVFNVSPCTLRTNGKSL